MSDSEGKLITFSGCLFAAVIWIVWQAGSGVPGVRGEKAPVPTWGNSRSKEGWGGSVSGSESVWWSCCFLLILLAPEPPPWQGCL